MTNLLALVVALLPLSVQPAGGQHVVVIGVDGLSSAGLHKARVPNVDQLREEGASTYHARGVMPTSRSPNWALIIMGADPEQHGVTFNERTPARHPIQ